MPISTAVKFEKIEKKEFEALPANVYPVQIMDIREKMKAPWGSPQGSDATELYLTFEFAVLDGKHKGRKLWKDVRPVAPVPAGSGFKPSWFYKIASAAVGHWLSAEEGVNFGPDETNALIGRQIKIVVNQTPPNGQGKSYNNITEVLPMEEQMEPLVADNVQDAGLAPIEEHPGINVDDIPF